MGWTSVDMPGQKTVLERLRLYSSYYEGNTWKGTDGTHEMRVDAVESGVGGAYAVLSRKNLATGTIARMAMVILVENRVDEFCWKTLLESEMPFECRFPKRLFKQLSAPELAFSAVQDQANSHTWRKCVEDYYRRTSASNKLVVGDIIDFAEPVNFTVRGVSIHVTRFEVSEAGRRKRFTAFPPSPHSRFVCRLSTSLWQHRKYTITRKGQEHLAVSPAS